MVIRHADPQADAAACAAVYEPYVRHSVATFEIVPPDAEEFSRRIAAYARAHGWLVAEHGGEVVGFAYASPHRTRAAYDWSCEVSVYIDAEHHRRGVGRSLYSTLFELLRRQGMLIALAGVTLPNPASVRLHESLGFELVGVYRRIGWKADGWRSVGWWQLELSAERPEPPPEPGPAARLDQR